MIKRIPAILALASAILWIFLTHSTNAATSKMPTGITVSPAFQQVELKENETSRDIEFKITNNHKSSETLSLSSADFNALSDTGGLFFVGSNPNALQKKYGLANWLILPQNTVTIPPKQTVKINATINNASDLAPGGHYGALMLALNTDSSKSTKKNQVAIHPIASSLLFVNKVGGDTHKLKLNDVKFSHSLFTLPSSVTLRFYNDGNTHLIPRGTVTINDPSGKAISQGVINEDSNIILPELSRLYTVPLKQLGSISKTGDYKLTVNFRFDGYDKFRTYQTSFMIIAFKLVVLVILTILVILCAIYLLKNKHARKQLLSIFHNIKIKS